YVPPDEGEEAEATDEAEPAETAEREEGEEVEEPEPIPEFIEVPLNLNPGKSWIGLISANNGGKLTITPMSEPEEEPSEGEETTEETTDGE
ncbi:MAG: hypothetical protein IJI73_00350, partial [Kiritimatiellae bacterium]|nr:hypothetical protein [Kiritimatiellia bacterium]